jgi:P-type E1-E2 ATPase
VSGHQIQITSRGKLASQNISEAEQLPPVAGGLECVVVIDGQFAATFRLRDAPRAEGRFFIQHLGPKHQFQHIMIVSGDRESEVRYLGEQVGISEIHAEQSPEQKLAIVRHETAAAKTLYVGDGINEALGGGLGGIKPRESFYQKNIHLSEICTRTTPNKGAPLSNA